MKEHPANPVRLVHQPPEQAPGEPSIDLLIRSAIEAPSEDTPLVKWRIRGTLRRRVERRSRFLRFALAGVLMFVAGGVVGAVVQPLLRSQSTVASPAELGAGANAGGKARKRSRPQASPSAIEATAVQAPIPPATEVAEAPPPVALSSTPAMAPPPAPSPGSASVVAPANAKPLPVPRKLATNLLSAQPARQPRERPEPAFQAAPLAPPAAPAMPGPAMPAPLTPVATTQQAPADEQALLSTALRKLRTGHEPEAALAALDEYRRRFPGGALAPEAARLRTEALLRLGRKDTVLAELDQPLAVEAPANDDRLVLRGELRAKAGRWQASLADFDAVVRAHPTNPTGADETADRRTRERLERAWWGRASARSHLGDDAGARADLREYLRRFPQGRFADQAVRLLGARR